MEELKKVQRNAMKQSVQNKTNFISIKLEVIIYLSKMCTQHIYLYEKEICRLKRICFSSDKYRVVHICCDTSIEWSVSSDIFETALHFSGEQEYLHRH